MTSPADLPIRVFNVSEIFRICKRSDGREQKINERIHFPRILYITAFNNIRKIDPGNKGFQIFCLLFVRPSFKEGRHTAVKAIFFPGLIVVSALRGTELDEGKGVNPCFIPSAAEFGKDIAGQEF